MLVLHYTGMKDARSALTRLCDPEARVSAHYMIDEDGTIYALVDEEFRAWHAGMAFWRGDRDINSRSIGIELVNPGHEFGYRAFPAAQMESLSELSRSILSRHPIPPRNIVGHSDIAPARKRDPGEKFDWAWLAAAGIGLWPGSEMSTPPATRDIRPLLAEWGYDAGAEIETTRLAVAAFQRHFRPSLCNGVVDADTIARLSSLIEMARVGSD
jgi:N-acetylmuramoyl-L-alanine amidase